MPLTAVIDRLGKLLKLSVCQVKVMTVTGNAWKEPVTVHCTCVIDNAAGNGYLSSDLECVGPKHNGYLRTVFVLSRDFSEMSSEEKAVNVSVSGAMQCCCRSLLFHYAALNESLQWEWCNCAVSLAVCSRLICQTSFDCTEIIWQCTRITNEDINTQSMHTAKKIWSSLPLITFFASSLSPI